MFIYSDYRFRNKTKIYLSLSLSKCRTLCKKTNFVDTLKNRPEWDCASPSPNRACTAPGTPHQRAFHVRHMLSQQAHKKNEYLDEGLQILCTGSHRISLIAFVLNGWRVSQPCHVVPFIPGEGGATFTSKKRSVTLLKTSPLKRYLFKKFTGAFSTGGTLLATPAHQGRDLDLKTTTTTISTSKILLHHH